MHKVIKFTKYLAISSFVLLISTILGQKNTQEYTFISLVHADVSGGDGGGGGAGCASDGDDAGGVDGGDGVDGTSSDSSTA